MRYALFLCLVSIHCNPTASGEAGPDTMRYTLPAPAAKAKAAPKPGPLRVVAVGDMMLGSNFPSAAELPPGEGGDLLDPAMPLLRSGQVVFGNVEGTFLDRGGVPKGSGSNVYCFRQPTAYVEHFAEAGFNLLSIANNHINDFGPEGILSTERTLESKGLAFAGSLRHRSAFLQVDSVKVGLVAFAPHSGTVRMEDLQAAVALVKETRSKCDVLIASFHAGAEGANATHVPKRKEIFLGQDRGDVHDFAHRMVDAGADAVIGHGPHVPRALELYKSRLIAYSLGNFCTYGQFSLRGVSGYAPLLAFEMNPDGSFKGGRIHSFLQEGEGGPVTDPQGRAARLMRDLSRGDFPDNRLEIDEDGVISIKD